jgi:predicted house-cleaning noncanonical NTP pyrophosphatase (MazG superfamily)
MLVMGRVYYNKLIRDKIPEKIARNGEECEVRTITDDQEFQQELFKKVAEEASALSCVRSREEFLSEYADLAFVLEELFRVQSISPEELAAAKGKNLEKKGGFEKRLFLNWSSDAGYRSNESPQGIKNN